MSLMTKTPSADHTSPREISCMTKRTPKKKMKFKVMTKTLNHSNNSKAN